MAKTSYTIEYAQGILDDLTVLRPSERKHVLDAIDKQLTYDPRRETRNRKLLRGLIPPWEHVEPVWELRIGHYREFYDVNLATGAVAVRALRNKPPHKTTEEIL